MSFLVVVRTIQLNHSWLFWYQQLNKEYHSHIEKETQRNPIKNFEFYFVVHSFFLLWIVRHFPATFDDLDFFLSPGNNCIFSIISSVSFENNFQNKIECSKRMDKNALRNMKNLFLLLSECIWPRANELCELENKNEHNNGKRKAYKKFSACIIQNETACGWTERHKTISTFYFHRILCFGCKKSKERFSSFHILLLCRLRAVFSTTILILDFLFTLFFLAFCSSSPSIVFASSFSTVCCSFFPTLYAHPLWSFSYIYFLMWLLLLWSDLSPRFQQIAHCMHVLYTMFYFVCSSHFSHFMNGNFVMKEFALHTDHMDDERIPYNYGEVCRFYLQTQHKC